MVWLFTQVWLWSIAGFLLGSLITWLLFAWPARRRLRAVARDYDDYVAATEARRERQVWRSHEPSAPLDETAVAEPVPGPAEEERFDPGRVWASPEGTARLPIAEADEPAAPDDRAAVSVRAGGGSQVADLVLDDYAEPGRAADAEQPEQARAAEQDRSDSSSVRERVRAWAEDADPAQPGGWWPSAAPGEHTGRAVSNGADPAWSNGTDAAGTNGADAWDTSGVGSAGTNGSAARAEDTVSLNRPAISGLGGSAAAFTRNRPDADPAADRPAESSSSWFQQKELPDWPDPGAPAEPVADDTDRQAPADEPGTDGREGPPGFADNLRTLVENRSQDLAAERPGESEVTTQIPIVDESEQTPLPRRTPGAGPRPGKRGAPEWAHDPQAQANRRRASLAEPQEPEQQDGMIKGHFASRQYHTPDSPQYDRIVAEVWFRTTADAEEAGFEPWDAEG
ncbi:hypothetical protein [Saccharopolyspora sp. SCSIO 74807]|uniref:sunset domain-containing protein n=1 Tax=Saccharopolyspora sp. SCSIO 74807 TaxID=3118084 RepID=UPI0030D060E2